MVKKNKKKKGTSYGGPSGGPHGGFTSSIPKPKPKPKPKPTQASLPPSMGFNPPNIDPGLAAAVASQAESKPDRPWKPDERDVSVPVGGIVDIGFGEGKIDPKLAQAAGLTQGTPWTSTSGWAAPSGTGTTIGPVGMGDIPPPETPPDDDDGDDGTDDETLTEEEKKDKALETAKELTDWWKKNNKGGYRAYGDRTTLGGKVRNSQEAVTAKIQDKLNKGYYKIVNGPQGQPLIIHASTGTPVNPYTGGIISTQAQGDQGGAYQNEMAKITGIDPKFAGVFSKEYQTGNGLSVGEMKPEHALRFLMKKNKGAFEQFFSMNKDKAGFNPFSLSFISTGMGAILNKITGPEALQVGNNLERAGWGKAIKGEDGKYKIQLTEQGAKNWSNSFNFDTVNIGDKTFTGFTSPEAIAKDKSKGYLSELLGTKKFPDQPVDLTNLIEQGGYAERTDLVNPLRNPSDPSSPNYNPNLGSPDFADPIPPQQVNYGFMPSFTPNMDVTGTPSSFTNVGGSTTNYPAFTPEGYKISSYNPTRDYSGGTGQTRTGDGGGDTTPDPNDPTDPNQPGPLTYDVYGRPITYDYTGGPEQIYLGGGYKRDGQYIGSPYGYSKGGIANFKPYGY